LSSISLFRALPKNPVFIDLSIEDMSTQNEVQTDKVRQSSSNGRVIYVEKSRKENFCAAFLVAALLSIFFTPIVGFLALLCFRGSRGAAGSLLGTSLGFLIYGIALLGLGPNMVELCTWQCGQRSSTVGQTEAKTLADCNCNQLIVTSTAVGSGRFGPIYKSRDKTNDQIVSIVIAALLFVVSLASFCRKKRKNQNWA
jgi:hypothetical protein